MNYFKRITALLLAVVMCLSYIPAHAHAATLEDLFAVDADVTLDGTNDGTATVAISTPDDFGLYAILGNWILAETESSEYLTLTEIGSDKMTFSGDNSATVEDGEVWYIDDTFNTNFEANDRILYATYSVAADTPAGEYTVTFDPYQGIIDADVNESYDVFTFTITVSVEEPEADCDFETPHPMTLPFSESSEDPDYDHYYAWTAPADGTFKVEASGAGEWVLYKDADDINSADGATYSVEMAKDDEIIVNLYHNGQGEAAWTVTFEEKKPVVTTKYRITWDAGNGKPFTMEVTAGTVPSYPAQLPTPTKESDAEFDYTFSGWSPAPYAADKDQTYTAQFTAAPKAVYEITWIVDGDRFTSPEVPYNTTPTFPATESLPTGCVELSWSPAIAPATKDTTYTLVVTPSHTYKYNCSTECEICGEGHREASHTYSELIPAKDAVHETDKLEPAVAAHYQCSECEKYFDENKTETTLEALTGETPVHAHDHYSIAFHTHQSLCSCGLAMGEKEDHDFTHDAQNHKCVCGKVEFIMLYLDGNGGSISDIGSIIRLGDDYNSTINADTLNTYGNIFMREGYRFIGWNTQADGKGQTVTQWTRIEETTLYAMWEGNPHAVTWTVDGKEYKKTNVKVGETIIAPEYTASEGYTFSGWDTSAYSTMPDTDLTFNATLIPKTYFVTWTVDGEEYKKTSVNYGEAITAPEYTIPEGHTFSGWDTSAYSTMPAENLEFNATLTINSYRLTVMNAEEEGETLFDEILVYGAEIPAIPDPERLGYKFKGWWPGIPETMPGHDVEIFAQWSDRIRPTITWNVDGNFFTTTNVDYGDKIQAPAYQAPAGYTFSGWDTSAYSTMPDTDLTFNATLIPKTYTVTWKIGDQTWTTEATYGEEIERPEVEIPENYYDYRWINVPETMPAEENLVIEGYWMVKVNVLDFEGNKMQFTTDGLAWDLYTKVVKAGDEVYLNYRGTNFVEGHTLYLVNTNTDEKYEITYSSGVHQFPEVTVNENTVFQLTKEANEHKITWTVNGEKIDETTVKYGEAITAPDYTAPEGYTSSGWTVPETMPDEDITLDATLTAKKYTLFLNFNGGTAMSGLGQIPVLTAYGTVLTETISFLDVSITRTGFGFTGWNTKADGTGEAITDENTMPAGEFTLYAQWECLHATTKPGVPNEDGETHSLVCANPECNGAAVEGSAPHTYGDDHVCECGAFEPYTVTLSGDCVTMDAVTAYHGQELVVKLHNDTGSSNRGVELRQVRVNGQIIDEKAYTFDENNTLTIPGELITGNVSISAEACVNVTIAINGAEVYLHEELAQGLTMEQLKAMLAEYCGYTEGSDIVNVYGVTYGSNNYAVLREFLTFFNKPHHNFGGFQAQNGTILEPNEVGAVQIDGDMQLTMLWEIEKFTLTVVDIAGEEHVLEVPYGTNIVDFLKTQEFYAEEYELNSEDRIGILTFGSWKDFYNDEDIQNDAIVTDDMSVYANSWLTGWMKGDLGWGYQIGNVFVSGWQQIDGDWYYLFLDEETGCSYRAEGTQRVPYPTEPINGITYKPDADAKAYYESKGETFIDAEEAWFEFGKRDGKFLFDETGFGYQLLWYYENGMQIWHPGVVERNNIYYYYIGNTEFGGNTLAGNADVYVQKVTKNNSNTIDFVIGGVYTTDQDGRICNYDGIINMADGTKRYYENARLMVGNGLTAVDKNFIYVDRDGELVVDAYYWVPANDLEIVEGIYYFDENGYLQAPQSTEKEGVYFENNNWYYYVDGVKQTNKGLISVENVIWHLEDGTEATKSGIIYVKTNGALATGNYWVTTVTNYKGDDVKSGDLLNFDDLGLRANLKNGMFEENGTLYFYKNGIKAYNAGVTIIDGKYYYVKSNAEVVRGRSYWITNVGDTEVVAKNYVFAADGSFEPEFLKDVKNGIVNGYYYVDGQLQYAAGVVYLEEEDCYIYVRSSGQIATGIYWATNTNGLLESKSYDWGESGKLFL